MEEEKKEKGMPTIEPSNHFEELQSAFNECLMENEKLRAELASSKRSMCELEEKASDVDNIRDLRAIEVAKHQAALSKTNDELSKTKDELSKTKNELSKTHDELFKQKDMFKQCKGYLQSTEEQAIHLKYKLEMSESTNVRLELDLTETRKTLAKECKHVKTALENHSRITQKITAEKDSLESRLAQYTDAYRELTIDHMTLEDMMKTVQYFHEQKVDVLQKQLDIAREIPEFPAAEPEEKEEKKEESARCTSTSSKEGEVSSLKAEKEKTCGSKMPAKDESIVVTDVNFVTNTNTKFQESPQANISLSSSDLNNIKEDKVNESVTDEKTGAEEISLGSADLKDIKKSDKEPNEERVNASVTDDKVDAEKPNMATKENEVPKLNTHLKKKNYVNQQIQSEKMTYIQRRRKRRRANEKAHKLATRLQREALLGELFKMRNIDGDGDGSAGEIDDNRTDGRKKRFRRRRQKNKNTSQEDSGDVEDEREEEKNLNNKQ